VIDRHIAGDPVKEEIRWLKLTQQEIVDLMKQDGISISRNCVRKLLKAHNFVKRKMLGKIRCGDFEDRSQQFDIIRAKMEQFKNSANPILSMDTKKKEYIGRFYRTGKVYCTQAIEVYDHTQDSLIEGILIPHGLYDMKTQKAYITIGTSHETAGFLCDSIESWWLQYGKKAYPKAEEILILCDAGGANSWRIYVFKVELQKLCNTLGLTITICHYPPYTSKWNPIEHRVFPHVARAMEGIILQSAEQVRTLIEKTTTKTGLQVKASIIKKLYKIGKVTPKKALESLNIKYGDCVPGLNYSIAPRPT
jgi:hypothetical protein